MTREAILAMAARFKVGARIISVQHDKHRSGEWHQTLVEGVIVAADGTYAEWSGTRVISRHPHDKRPHTGHGGTFIIAAAARNLLCAQHPWILLADEQQQ